MDSAAPDNGRLAARLGTALLFLFSIGIALTAVEVAFRLSISTSTDDDLFVGDPVFHHRRVPNTTVVVRGVEITSNSLGLRDREYSAEKPEGTFRILMLGDSFTAGAGLSLEDTAAKRVEADLDTCGGHFEVVNAGIGSYSPILEYLLLKQVGLPLNPDLIVLNFDMTDVHDDFIRTNLARLDADGLPLAVPSDPRAEAALVLPPLRLPSSLRFLAPLEKLAHRLALYQRIRKSDLGQRLLGRIQLTPEDYEAAHLIGNFQYDRMAITRDGDLPGAEAAWQPTRRYLIGIWNLARAHHIPFGLVVYPHAHQVSASESPEGRRAFGVGPGLVMSDRPFRLLEDLGREQGFPVINLKTTFREHEATGGPLFQTDDIHHTPRGAHLLADGILQGLLAHHLVPCPAPAGHRAANAAALAP